jgi:hypothetical protein
MQVKTVRSLAGGRPPFGEGRYNGRSGLTSAHRASPTNREDIGVPP